MVYISGSNKNRLGTRRFDALFAAGCGQLQQDNGDRMSAAPAPSRFPAKQAAGFLSAIDQG
ncbi:hypothetical protein HJB52_21405 [Rhizobium lentis]|uniref:hypothetical protein n=1 Tax=Rhizobium lentis TaxID=1138194 RepID=UPI001C8400E6|nr:hypothetical protein [Rhizobium lentis]MBX5104387.1 hypothetical protein [Rhizobium lentis]